jgi:GT2 family glycosyltransferase
VFGSEEDHVERFGHTTLDIDYLAATGAALLTPKDLFTQIGGFTPELPLNFNDVDYCLKVGAAGRDVVVTPFARLYHFESSTRGHASEPSEMAFLVDHWKLRIESDRHLNFRSSR